VAQQAAVLAQQAARSRSTSAVLDPSRWPGAGFGAALAWRGFGATGAL
jgi:hypothetical protein